MAEDDVLLIGYDGVQIPVSKALLEDFPYFKGMIRLEEGKNEFRFEIVDGFILRKIASWIEYRGGNNMPELLTPEGKLRNLTEFEENFVKNIDTEDLVTLMIAADFFILNNLQEILTTVIAERITELTIKEIRLAFRIENSGYTPEEEQKLTSEISWALQFKN